jgi:hypothetical protein
VFTAYREFSGGQNRHVGSIPITRSNPNNTRQNKGVGNILTGSRLGYNLMEHDDSWVPESFKEGMKAAAEGRFVDMETALFETPPPHLR